MNRFSPRRVIIPSLLLATVTITVLTGTGCTAEKVQSAKAPDVDVDVDPGRLPKFDIKWADVDVGTTTKTITVPRLEWKREEMQIQVPYIDINAPGTGDKEERTVTVELEVPGGGYDLQIRQVRATGDELWVISELRQTNTKQGSWGRVSDQVVVNAPENLRIRRVIVGQRPDGVYNRQYTFYPSMSALQQRLPAAEGRVLYQKSA